MNAVLLRAETAQDVPITLAGSSATVSL
eukprot:COSAG02_NODE_68355_length_249_cov_1810.500000_1_plen_27_part_10